MAEQTRGPDVSHTPVRSREEPEGDFQALMDELRWTKPLREGLDPARAASVVLCHLERRLTGSKREEIAQHLPEALRRTLSGCQRVDGSPAQRVDERTFLGDVGDELGLDSTKTFQVVTAVFTALRDRLPDDEDRWVANQLPPDLADLWRRPV